MEETAETTGLFSSKKSKLVLLTLFSIIFIVGISYIIIMSNWCRIEKAFAPPPVTVRLDPAAQFEPIEDVPYDDKESIIQYLNGYQKGWLFVAEHNSVTIEYNGEGLTIGSTTHCFTQEPYREGFRRGEDDAGKKLHELTDEARKKFNE